MCVCVCVPYQKKVNGWTEWEIVEDRREDEPR